MGHFKRFILAATFSVVALSSWAESIFSAEEMEIINQPIFQNMLINAANTEEVVGQVVFSTAEVNSLAAKARELAEAKEGFEPEAIDSFVARVHSNIAEANTTYSALRSMSKNATGGEALIRMQMKQWDASSTVLYTEDEIQKIGNDVKKEVKKANDRSRCRFNPFASCENENKAKRNVVEKLRDANAEYSRKMSQKACLDTFIEEMKNSTDEEAYIPCGINKSLSLEEIESASGAITPDEKKVSCKIEFGGDGASENCFQDKETALANAQEENITAPDTITITNKKPKAKRQGNFSKKVEGGDECFKYNFTIDFWAPPSLVQAVPCSCGLVFDIVTDYNAPTAIVEVLREKGVTFLGLDDDIMKKMITDLGDIDKGSSIVGPSQGIFSAGTGGMAEFVPRKMYETNVFGVEALSRHELDVSGRDAFLVQACKIMEWVIEGGDGGGGGGDMGEAIEVALGFYEMAEQAMDYVEQAKQIRDQVRNLTNINNWPIVQKMKRYRDLAKAVHTMVKTGNVDPNVLCQAEMALTEASTDLEDVEEMISNPKLDAFAPADGNCTDYTSNYVYGSGTRVGMVRRNQIEGYAPPAGVNFAQVCHIQNATKDKNAALREMETQVNEQLNQLAVSIGYQSAEMVWALPANHQDRATLEQEVQRLQAWSDTQKANIQQAFLDQQKGLGTISEECRNNPAMPEYAGETNDSQTEYFLMTRDEADELIPYYDDNRKMVFLCDQDQQYLNPLTNTYIKGQWSKSFGPNYQKCLAAQEAAHKYCADAYILPKQDMTDERIRNSGLVDNSAMEQDIPGMSAEEEQQLRQDVFDGLHGTQGPYDDPADFAAADINKDGKISNFEREQDQRRQIEEVEQERQDALAITGQRINELGGSCVAGKPVGVWTGLVGIQALQSGDREQAIGALYALQPWAEEKINELTAEKEEKMAEAKAECEAQSGSSSTSSSSTEDWDAVTDELDKASEKRKSCEVVAAEAGDEYDQKIAEVEQENSEANAAEQAMAKGQELQDSMMQKAEETKEFMSRQVQSVEGMWAQCQDNYGMGSDQESLNNTGCPSGGFVLKCPNAETGKYTEPQSACNSSQAKRMCYNSRTGQNDMNLDDISTCRSIGKNLQAVKNTYNRYSEKLGECGDSFDAANGNRTSAADWRMHGPSDSECGGSNSAKRIDGDWYCVSSSGAQTKLSNPYESSTETSSFCSSIGEGTGAVKSIFMGEDCSKISDEEERKQCEEEQPLLADMKQSFAECQNDYSSGSSNTEGEEGGICAGAGELMNEAGEYLKEAEDFVNEQVQAVEDWGNELVSDMEDYFDFCSEDGESSEEGGSSESSGSEESSSACGLDMGGLLDDVKEAMQTVTEFMEGAGSMAARADGFQRMLDGCNLQSKMQSMVARTFGVGFTMGYISTCDDRWHEGKPTLVQKLKNKLGNPSAFCPISFLMKEGLGENPISAFFESMGMCVGMWGALEPRTGITKDANGFRGAALAAFRGFSIAKSMNTITWNKYEWKSKGWDIKRDHVPGKKTDGLKGASPMPMFNMDYPHRTGCYPTGTADIMWDSRLLGEKVGGGGENLEPVMNMGQAALEDAAKQAIDEMFPAIGFDFGNIGNIKDAAEAVKALETTLDSVQSLQEQGALGKFLDKVLDTMFNNLLNNGLLSKVGVDQTDAHTFTFWGSEGCTASYCTPLTIPWLCSNNQGPHFQWHGEFAETF